MDASFLIAPIFPGVSLGNFLIGIFVIASIFLIFREITTWYWKINEIIELLEEIRKNTKKDNCEK
jgi:ABC-type uncharacterized transport system permease subunit